MLASMTRDGEWPRRRRVRLAENDAQHVGVIRENRGRPRRSPMRAIFIGGSAPKCWASVTATAAPVGVVSSIAGPRA